MCGIQGVYRAIQFIERHLGDPVTVQDIADAAGYSLYHFSREFNRLIGHSPYDYLIRRRLSESVSALLESDARIIDIAAEAQFNNPETYSRAFRRMFGVLPSEARQGKALGGRIRCAITLDYIRHINKGHYLTPQYVERKAVHLVGMAAWATNKGIADALWDRFEREMPSIPGRASDERYRLFFFSTGQERACTFCLVGVEEALETGELL